MPRSLVIGANGFIGSHLVDALVRAGHDVTAFDRFSGSESTFTSSVRLIQGEFLSRSDLELAVRDQDNVFHFLSTTTPATAESDPTLDIRTNVAQTVELFESCVSTGVGHVYFASSGGAIYGDQGKGEYAESDRALPVSPYGIGKLAIEHYLRYFKTKHRMASTSFRISNPYGPRQRINRRQGFIPIALRQIALGLPVERFGDGSMVRDYIYVEDAVDAIAKIVSRGSNHDLYNIGSGVGYTVNEVLATLQEITGREVLLEQRPVPSTFVDSVILNNARYEEEFGRILVTDLKSGASNVYREILEQDE